MQPQRVTSLLQGVADVRNWVVRNVPLTASMVGYDLFLKIGNDFFANAHIELDAIYRALPHPEEEIRLHIAKMAEAGLVVEQAAGPDGGARRLVPTHTFIALLDRYRRKFESLFILRKGLRDQQLLVASRHHELGQFAETLYDHFYDLGWLYLHNFGGVCFLAASLVKRVASAYGMKARVESGYVRIKGSNIEYLLGGKGFAAPGQIEGHAMCVIDDALIIDFGLGNVRKGYRRDFYWALACDYQPQGEVLGAMTLPSGEALAWRNDWRSPDTEAELKKYEPAVEELFGVYASYFG